MIKVLVVDDDKLVRKGLISAMPWQQFQMQVVGEANNGGKALEFLQSHDVDLLLTDLAMPVMSGIELMRAVRKQFPHIHIVVLTLHRDFEYVQEALRLGAIDYIAKVQLEKETFDEVLGRIAERIREKRGQPKREPVPGGIGAIASDCGYAFVPLQDGADDAWLGQLGLPGGADFVETVHRIRLWLPPGGPATDTANDLPLGEADIPPGWFVLQLDGLAGIRFKALQEWLKGYMDIELFYDYRPDVPLVRADVRDGTEGGRAQPEEEATDWKAQWSSSSWIHQDELFARRLGELRRARLKRTKLIGLIYRLIDEWNRLFQPVCGVTVEPADSFDYWYQVEAWFRGVRDTIRCAIGKSAYSREVVEAILKAVDTIHEEAHLQVTAVDLARKVNMSRSYFSQCFKDIVGFTCNDYLRRVRIDKAKSYLLHTNKTIAWIAEHTGYMDEKYFSRTFREQTGMLPSDYRHLHRERGEMSGN